MATTTSNPRPKADSFYGKHFALEEKRRQDRLPLQDYNYFEKKEKGGRRKCCMLIKNGTKGRGYKRTFSAFIRSWGQGSEVIRESAGPEGIQFFLCVS